MPINANYDIETCSWCNGEGIDLSYKGQLRAPRCGRCSGSGKIYVTDELSTTKRRRKYMGPVPKSFGDTIAPEMLITTIPVITAVDGTVSEYTIPKRRGRPKKVASGNNPPQ